MIKVFIANFHKYGDWFLGDIKCDENMKKLWHNLDGDKEEMYMILNEDEILELKK